MKRQARLQLEKVLALADSAHDGEAIAALRKARAILLREGISFTDLARIAIRHSTLGKIFGVFSKKSDPLKMEVMDLRQQILDLQMRIEAESYKAANWRQKTGLLEQKLGLSQAETERWQQLAHETVERLSDFGNGLPEPIVLDPSLNSKRA